MQQETVTLRGNNGFPVAVAPKGDLPNLADVAATRCGDLGFGITRENAGAALRLLADQLDAGTVLPQRLVDATETTVDEFTLHTLTFVFAVKHEPKPKA